MTKGELHLTAILLCAFMIYGYCFSALSLEFQNDFDQGCTLTNKIAGADGVLFNPAGDQSISSNGGKTDLTVTIYNNIKISTWQYINVWSYILQVD